MNVSRECVRPSKRSIDDDDEIETCRLRAVIYKDSANNSAFILGQ